MSVSQNLADGAVGVALWHLESGRWPAALEALRQACAGGVSIANGASLFYGAPALAFVLACTDEPALARARATVTAGTVTLTRRRLDAARWRMQQWQQSDFAEWDLIRGLTGLGVVLRRAGEVDVLRDVLTYLVRLTEPVAGLPGWWCRHGPDRSQPAPAGGHSNHGLAHGICGPLALLALTHLDGVTVDGQVEAIERICRWLDRWQRHSSTGVWWPQTVTLADLQCEEPSQRGPWRPSWCYGTPGMARAQQLAGRALGDPVRQQVAVDAFTSCLADPDQLAQLVDRGLCHGTAGVLATGRRIAADATTAVPVEQLEALHQRTTTAADKPAGFLDGASGAALAAAGTTVTGWDACLLLS